MFVDDDADDRFIYGEVCQKPGILNKLKFFHDRSAGLKYLRETTEKPFKRILDYREKCRHPDSII